MSVRYFVHSLINPEIFQTVQQNQENQEITKILKEVVNLTDSVDSYTIDRNEAIPQEIYDQILESGVYSLTVPRKFGGLEASMTDFTRVIEKLAYMDASVTMSVVPHLGMGIKSILFGTDEQKSILLSKLKERKGIVSFALTEADAGSDVAAQKTTLTSDENGGYVLNGIKTWITNGSIAKTLIIAAKCPDLTKIPNGAVMVYVYPDERGVTIANPYDKMGNGGAVTSEIYLTDVKVTPERLIGEPGKAINSFNVIVDSGRMGVTVGSTSCLERTQDFYRSMRGENANDELLRKSESLLYRIRATISMTAKSHDLKLDDASIATALTKNYGTNHSYRMINEFITEAGLAAGVRNDGISLMFRTVPVFRITEGPNSIIAYKAGVDLATSLMRKVEGATGISEHVHPELKEYAARFDSILSGIHERMTFLSTKYKPLSMHQLALERVTDFFEPLYAFFSTLLKATEDMMHDSSRKDELVKFCRDAAEETEHALKLFEKKENHTFDGEIAELNRQISDDILYLLKPKSPDDEFSEMILDAAEKVFKEADFLKIDKNRVVPENLIKNLYISGLYAITLPEDYGGLNADENLTSEILEKIAERDVPLAVRLLDHLSMFAFVSDSISEKAKEDLLVYDEDEYKFISGGLNGNVYGDGDEFTDGEIVSEDDQSITLDVEKEYAVFDERFSENYYIVKVKHNHSYEYIYLKGNEGNAEITSYDDPMGLRSVPFVKIRWNRLTVPADRIIQFEDRGRSVQRLNTYFIHGLMAMASAVSGWSFREAWNWSSNRIIFQKPLKDFETIQSYLSEILRSHVTLGGIRKKNRFSDPVARKIYKLYISDRGFLAADMNALIHGGNGYMEEMGVARFVRDARFFAMIGPSDQEIIEELCNTPGDLIRLAMNSLETIKQAKLDDAVSLADISEKIFTRLKEKISITFQELNFLRDMVVFADLMEYQNESLENIIQTTRTIELRKLSVTAEMLA